MNVYTHVDMADLHDDVESLPGTPSRGRDPGAPKGEGTPTDMPSDLAGLISSWSGLPENIRSIIASLAVMGR